jgi:hypothetical protein
MAFALPLTRNFTHNLHSVLPDSKSRSFNYGSIREGSFRVQPQIGSGTLQWESLSRAKKVTSM